jgi:hypothetical protein
MRIDFASIKETERGKLLLFLVMVSLTSEPIECFDQANVGVLA